MKIDDLKLMSDRDFYKLVKEVKYNSLSEENKTYYDYVNKQKAKSLAVSFSSILAYLSAFLNKNEIENSEDIMILFCAIGIISSTVWLIISGITYEEKPSKNEILITKRLLEKLNNNDLNELINIYKEGSVKGYKISVNYMYDRLEKLGMLNILNEIEIENDVKYNDDSKSSTHHKKLKNN